MAIKPILFNTPMALAVRSDIKTETRRQQGTSNGLAIMDGRSK